MPKVKMQITELPLLLTVRHLTDEIGLSRAMAYRLMHREDMPVVVIGRRRFLKRDDFLNWLDCQREGGADIGTI